MSENSKSTFQKRDTVKFFNPEKPQETELTVDGKPSKKAFRTIVALIIIIIAVVIVLGGLNLLQFYNNQQQIEAVKNVYLSAIDDRDKLLAEQYELVKELRIAAGENRGGDTWLDENVGFIPDNEERLYHRFTCPEWQGWGGPYWVFNVEYAEYMYFNPHTCLDD